MSDQRPVRYGTRRAVRRSPTPPLTNPDLSVHDIARSDKVAATYIYSILRLPWLAPDIIDAIVNGRQPSRLTARKPIHLSAHLPIDWADQRKLLGFAPGEVAHV